MSSFVRAVPRRPPQFQGRASVQESHDGLRLHRDEEPARYVVGLDEFAEVEKPDRRPGNAPIPSEDFAAAPADARRFCGRAHQVDASGAVHAQVWEYPSGRAGMIVLPADARMDPERPRPGAFLRIWTWREESPDGTEQEHVYVVVRNRALSENDRAVLEGILQRLATARESE